MRVIHRYVFCVAGVAVLCGFTSSPVHADPLYTVTDLGAASPSAAYLSGQSPGDPSGNYLSLLSASQQAVFQAGSFDVYAHPSTSEVYGDAFYLLTGDIVDSNQDNEQTQVYKISLATSNNVGVSVGVGTEYAPTGSLGPPFPQLVTFTSDPHTVTYAPYYQSPWITTTEQSPGYLHAVYTRMSASTPQAAGINDSGLTAFNLKLALPGSTVFTAYLGDGNQSLGTLGGASALANALNNSNEVVGWSQTASGAQHAFLYTNSSMEDLNLLIPSASGITLVSAVGIDSAGDIIAYGTDSSGQMNEYFLAPAEVPAPEPGTLAIMGVMIVAFATHTLHRRARRR